MSSLVTQVQADVKDYYGKVLSRTSDLKTNACTTSQAPPPYIIDALRNVHDEVQSKYYGCGTVVPEALAGASVLGTMHLDYASRLNFSL